MFDTSPDGLKKLIAQGEAPKVEFKDRFTADRLIARHVVAFANSLGGIIFFGVGSKGELLGLSREEEEYTRADPSPRGAAARARTDARGGARDGCARETKKAGLRSRELLC